jgi:hypothetical protein
MYVLREFELAPGNHRVDVRFEREGTAPTPPRDERNEPEREHEREVQRRAIPPVLRLDTTVTVPANAVLLVTYSSELRKLVLSSPAGAADR